MKSEHELAARDAYSGNEGGAFANTQIKSAGLLRITAFTHSVWRICHMGTQLQGNFRKCGTYICKTRELCEKFVSKKYKHIRSHKATC